MCMYVYFYVGVNSQAKKQRKNKLWKIVSFCAKVLYFNYSILLVSDKKKKSILLCQVWSSFGPFWTSPEPASMIRIVHGGKGSERRVLLFECYTSKFQPTRKNQSINQPTNQENLILYKSNFALQLHKQTLQKVACSKVVARRGEKTLKNAKAYERE